MVAVKGEGKTKKKKLLAEDEIAGVVMDLMQNDEDVELIFKREQIEAKFENIWIARLYIVAKCLAPQEPGSISHFTKKFFMRKMKFPTGDTQSQRFNYYAGLLKELNIGYTRKHQGHKSKRLYIKSVDNFDDELFNKAALRHQRSKDEE